MAIDLKGQKFGMLEAIEPTSKRGSKGEVVWKCVCDCGNYIYVNSNKLRTGHTKSCGCLKIIAPKTKRKGTIFDLSGEYGIGYTVNTGLKFFFDKDDFELIKDYTWRENDQGYITSIVDGKNIRLHRIVMKCNDDRLIDHKNRKRFDNRKHNLRYASKQSNGINRGPNKNNILGVKGVSRHKSNGKYTARIMIDGKSIYIGTFDKIENAIKAREDAEVAYFGEFAYTKEVV